METLRRPLKDHVYDYISSRIDAGELSAGDRLSEQTICDAMGVSRTRSAKRSSSWQAMATWTISPAADSASVGSISKTPLKSLRLWDRSTGRPHISPVRT